MKKGTSRTYLYLLMVLLVGLLLAGFIQPLMEGFREGAANPCNSDFDFDSKNNLCVSKRDLVSGGKCNPISGKDVKPGQNGQKCVYTP